jgi:predicted O-linked N-acetylglucosamine transferase (SPINDLY family)
VTVTAKGWRIEGDRQRDAGRFEEAVQCYERSLALQPADADAHNNLGVVLGALGNKPRAAECFRAALALEPGFVEARINMGNMLQEQGRFEDAIAAYRAALESRPDSVLAHNNLAALYSDLGRFDEAEACEREVLRLAPNDGIRVKQALRLPVVAASTREIAALRERMRGRLMDLLASDIRLEDPLAEVGQTTFLLPYHGLNDRELHSLLGRLYEKACPALRHEAPHCRGRAHLQGRRRVGFLSRYFFDHSVGTWFARAIDRLAAEDAMDVVVIATGAGDDERFARTFPSVKERVALPFDLASAREQVAALRLDVLAYADLGMDPLSYFLAFSRLAPVQCTMLGHPVTSGVPAVDYFISSALMEPPGAEAHYSEALVPLASMPAYMARPVLPRVPKTRAALGLPEDRRLYVCPTMLQKLHPDFDRAAAAILRQDPGGELVLFRDLRFPNWHQAALDRFAATMPDVLPRVRFLPWLTRDELMSVLMQADVVLDTPHFGAATTTLLVLAAGTPIVTLPGQFARARASLACYREIGVLDCVAGTLEEYAAIAVRVANDRAWRDSLKSRIVAACGVLYDDPRLVAELGRVMRELQPLSRGAASPPASG